MEIAHIEIPISNYLILMTVLSIFFRSLATYILLPDLLDIIPIDPRQFFVATKATHSDSQRILKARLRCLFCFLHESLHFIKMVIHFKIIWRSYLIEYFQRFSYGLQFGRVI
jgi:hypothetical protein